MTMFDAQLQRLLQIIKSFYVIVRSLRLGLNTILSRWVRVSTPFRSTATNHHAAAEIDVSAGK